jgi:hypothetical protein
LNYQEAADCLNVMKLGCCEPRTSIESYGSVWLNRHAAVCALNGKINHASLGEAEWLRCTKPNKPFDRSANSGAFIGQLEGLVRCLRARSIPALGRFAFKESRVEWKEARQSQIAHWMLTSRGLPNKRLHPTGNSLPVIENLSHDVVVSRRVNRGVRVA